MVRDAPEQFAITRQADRLLVRLEAAFYDDYGSPLDAASKAGFSRVMRWHADKIPLLGAESTGKVVATWAKGDECLTLQFIDRLRFNFSFVSEQQGQLSRRWGTANALTFFDEYPKTRRLVAA